MSALEISDENEGELTYINDFEEQIVLPTILDNIKTGRHDDPKFRKLLFWMLPKGKGKHLIEYLFLMSDVSRRNADRHDEQQRRIGSCYQHIAQLFANTVGDCDFYNDSKLTVLHFACRYGWQGIVQSLLSEGADPNSKDKDNTTPLLEATSCHHGDVVDLLVESGADIFCLRNDNYTLLHAAAGVGWINFVQFLLQSGADINATANRGVTPLYMAVLGSHKDMIALLIESGADMACGHFHGSLLHFSVFMDNLEIVKFLVERGANVNTKGFQGLTPLSLACRFQKIETIEYLVDAVNVRNGSYETPLKFIMRDCPNLQLIKMFTERYGYPTDFIDDFYGAETNLKLKMNIFQNPQVCTQAILTKFNNVDLPAFYSLPLPEGPLLPLQNLTIASQDIIQDIEESVRHEINANGHCDLRRPRVIVLSMLAVTSYINYYNDIIVNGLLARANSVESSQIFSETQCID